LLITEDENPLDIDECCLDPSGKGLSDLR